MADFKFYRKVLPNNAGTNYWNTKHELEIMNVASQGFWAYKFDGTTADEVFDTEEEAEEAAFEHWQKITDEEAGVTNG